MSTSIAELIRDEHITLATELVAQETLLLQSIESPWATPESDFWVYSLFRDFHNDIQLREMIYRDALLAWAGVLENDSRRPGHISDWLRCHCYLYADLSPSHRQEVRDCVIEFLLKWGGRHRPGPSRVEERDEAMTDNLATVLNDLYDQLQSATACFRFLGQVDSMAPADHRCSSAIEKYWNASASVSAMFTIDWASFGREDLFDYNGSRAAAWLCAEGYATPSSAILQIGCGMGRIERHLAPRVKRVYGADISQNMIRLGRQWLAGIDNVVLLKTNGHQLPLLDGSIDTIFSFLVFIHIHDPGLWQGIFNEVARVLKPDGRFLFTVESNASKVERAEIKLFAKSLGLEAVSISPVNSRSINSFTYWWDWLFVFRKKNTLIR
jgi:SAM-dependent methyltransferase